MKKNRIIGDEANQKVNKNLSKQQLGKEKEESTNLNKQAESAIDFSEAIIATIRQPLLVLDQQFRITTVNNSFQKVFGITEKEARGKLIYNLDNNQWDIPDLRKLLEESVNQKEDIIDFEITQHFSDRGDRTMLINAHTIAREDTNEDLILLYV